jgi:uncharacterized protein YodC (DUF2158 family)
MEPILTQGDVVRLKNSAEEMTVVQVRCDGVRCLWFTDGRITSGEPNESWFDLSMLEMAWKNDGTHVPHQSGDIVQLASCGPLMTMGAATEGGVECSWFCGRDLHSACFGQSLLILDKATIGETNWASIGDPVCLRSGGPAMVVVKSDGVSVACSLSSSDVVTFDSRMLVLDGLESERRTSEELVRFAEACGVDFRQSCHHCSFLVEGRFIIWWRKTTTGPVHYLMQGWIEPQMHQVGICNEAGHVAGIRDAFEFTKAWLFDQTVLEQLPERTVTRWDGPRMTAKAN